MRAIKIDVVKKSVYEIDIPAESVLDELYRALECTCVDAVFVDFEETLWIDDEGLLRNPPLGAFKVGRRVYSGHGVILGTSYEGESAPTGLTVQQVYTTVTFVDVSELPEPTMTFIPL